MSIKVSRVFHAGYQFEYQNTRILFDPIFENPMSVNCFSHSKITFNHELIQKLDFHAIFISHIHDDHLSMFSLNYLNKEIPIYIFCVDVLYIELIKKIGFQNVIQLKLNEQICIDGMMIHCLPALDRDIDCLFHLQVEDINILNVVDSWIDWDTCTKLSQLCTWDLVLWPFQQMRELEVLCPSRTLPSDQKIVDEHIKQLEILRPKRIIASSCQFIHEEWSWYRYHYFPISYQSFKNQVNDFLPNTDVIRLEPSFSLYLSKNEIQHAPQLDWIQIDLSTISDYEYLPDLAPQSLIEIAKYFPQLNLSQLADCHNFLKHEFNLRWNCLDHENFIYPKSKFNWLFILYELSETTFESVVVQQKIYFEINYNEIKQVQVIDQEQIHWLTEISLYKFHKAIAHAESLSSLYIRINDRHLNDQSWNSLFDFDLLADPLLRILYEGKSAYYQSHQMKLIIDKNSSLLND